MIITIEKEITINSGRYWQSYLLRAEIEVIDGRAWVRAGDGTVFRRRPLSTRLFPAADLWELLSYEQQQEFVLEAKAEYARVNPIVVKKVQPMIEIDEGVGDLLGMPYHKELKGRL